MTIENRRFDAARYLESAEDIAAFLEDAFSSNDPAVIAAALGAAARAHGMTELARDTGLNRAQLYRSLSADGSPELSTVLKVLAALGVRLQATPISAEAA
ncbi:MAG: addiction module antidote protein [Phenylobacterium sp.]|nr:addiction module antidote protein [Phenylobacterium sp.]